MEEQIESIAVKYALLMEERLDKALADGENDISDMEQVDEGIKMLGYLVKPEDLDKWIKKSRVKKPVKAT